jgi:hypothetical protein
VYQVSSAVIPYLVDLTPDLAMADRRDVWIQLGFLVTAGAGRFPSPPAPGLQDGLDAALLVAQRRAVLDFVTDTAKLPQDAVYFALACVALSGHRVGRTSSRRERGWQPTVCP